MWQLFFHAEFQQISAGVCAIKSHNLIYLTSGETHSEPAVCWLMPETLTNVPFMLKNKMSFILLFMIACLIPYTNIHLPLSPKTNSFQFGTTANTHKTASSFWLKILFFLLTEITKTFKMFETYFSINLNILNVINELKVLWVSLYLMTMQYFPSFSLFYLQPHCCKEARSHN